MIRRTLGSRGCDLGGTLQSSELSELSESSETLRKSHNPDNLLIRPTFVAKTKDYWYGY